MSHKGQGDNTGNLCT